METILLYGKDGTEYRAYVHQEWLDASSMDGFASMPGLKTVMLFNGIPLNYLDKDTFKNSITGELLSRVDPKRK